MRVEKRKDEKIKFIHSLIHKITTLQETKTLCEKKQRFNLDNHYALSYITWNNTG